MVGIYRIVNTVTGESYIGQSTDIAERFNQHVYHRTATNTFEVDKDMNVLPLDRFSFQILELCKPEELDEKESYYIDYYKSNIYGYNKIAGGQHNIGESNPNAKLTAQEIYDIREAYNNHQRKWSVYELYKDKVTKYSFSNIWDGYSWKDIHYDVYTEENKIYYMREATNGENSELSLFTNAEVLELRKRYVTESAKEIYESVKDKVKYQTLQGILCGRAYKDVPIYDKKNKIWKND